MDTPTWGKHPETNLRKHWVEGNSEGNHGTVPSQIKGCRGTVTAPSDGFDVGRPAIGTERGITRIYPKTLQFSCGNLGDSYDFAIFFSKPEKNKELETWRN